MPDTALFQRKKSLIGLLGLALSLMLISGCTNRPGQGTPSDAGTRESSDLTSGENIEEFEIVNCLLPGQMRRLGTHVTYVTARRPIRTTAEDCAIRGGEYTSADRADYQTSLKVWLDAAQEGDAKAQYFVGTLYEKGPKGNPDYALAAVWYEKAAKQGHRQAAMNLGRLYEQGLGVPRSAQTAFKWYTEASGLAESDLSMLRDVDVSNRIQELEQKLGEKEREVLRLRSHIHEIEKELEELQNQLQHRSTQVESEREKLLSLQTRYETVQQQVKTKEVQHEQAQEELRKLKQQLTQDAGASQNLRNRIQELEGVLAASQRDQKEEHLEKELQDTRANLDRQQAIVNEREREVQQLHQRIASLEQEVKQQNQELIRTSPVDLGFEGPTIEIIDPPLAPTRGIAVVDDVPQLPGPVGVPRNISGRVLAPAGLRALTINGHAVSVDDQGIFTMDFPPLQRAQDTLPVQILAIDIQDKRAAKKLKLVAGHTEVTGPKLSEEEREVFGNYYALVIGNDHYRHWNPLQNAIADAQAVADILGTRYGFKVTFLKDATRRDILKELNNFRKNLQETDNLLVFYAGHGHLETDIDRGYWIPVDAEIDDTSEWILTPSITDLLELMSAKHILVIADSCFAGKLTRSGLAKLRPGLSEEARMAMLKTVAKKRVRTALTSGGEHPVLDVGEGGHSVFTGALLEVLEDNHTILETERLFLAVRTRVVNAADKYKMEQIPTYWPIQFSGHESLGDFIFVPHRT